MRVTRRSLIQGALATPAYAQAGGQPPGIVFLFSDDHSVPDLGCYGNRAIRTPHLDRLAAEGMRFEHCYVASPQCSPNRSAVFTGCAPHTTATSRLHAPLPPWEVTFRDVLKQRGYYTGAFRKVHQGPEFDKRWDFYGPRGTPFSRFFDALPTGRPFFLQLGFTDPHRPYRPGMFSPPHDPVSVGVPPYLPDTPAVREDLAHYYDAIARMDAECGEILGLLDKHGLAENTMVVFSSDNGLPFPGAKGTCYDPGLRVPLIVRWPGRVAPGSVRSELISHVDLAPTWIEAAGGMTPEKMQGGSFLPLLTGGAYRPRDAIFAERNWHDNFDPIRAVRTRRYKLIFNAAPHFPYRPAWDLADSVTWKSYLEQARRGGLQPHHLRLLQPSRPVLELYDLEKDPNEFTNLATHAGYVAVRRELEATLSAWMHDTYDYLPPATPRPGQPSGRDWPLSL